MYFFMRLLFEIILAAKAFSNALRVLFVIEGPGHLAHVVPFNEAEQTFLVMHKHRPAETVPHSAPCALDDNFDYFLFEEAHVI